MPNQCLLEEKADCSMNTATKLFFVERIMHWNSTSNGRKMPWKGEKNPYRIWLSEIILQQTRVQQGLDYYNRFISAYPTIHDLRAAKEADVFKLWEGLGYYRRCKNMLAAANHIVDEMEGVFPSEYEKIQALKGVGPYTSAAIASFAFNLPHAVLDGNVYRVLARFFGISQSIDSTEGKKYFAQLAHELLDKEKPAIYNQGIMDFGAVICKPLPDCVLCPIQKRCIALREDLIGFYPVKEKKKERRVRWLYYIVAEHNDNLLIKMRVEKDIWQNLHEFFLIESGQELSNKEIFAEVHNVFGEVAILDISKMYSQHLTHQTIKGKFLHIRLRRPVSINGFTYQRREDLQKVAFPRYITTYFQDSRLLSQW